MEISDEFEILRIRQNLTNREEAEAAMQYIEGREPKVQGEMLASHSVIHQLAVRGMAERVMAERVMALIEKLPQEAQQASLAAPWAEFGLVEWGKLAEAVKRIRAGLATEQPDSRRAGARLGAN